LQALENSQATSGTRLTRLTHFLLSPEDEKVPLRNVPALAEREGPRSRRDGCSKSGLQGPSTVQVLSRLCQVVPDNV
jgi:hypothetical protein